MSLVLEAMSPVLLARRVGDEGGREMSHNETKRSKAIPFSIVSHNFEEKLSEVRIVGRRRRAHCV
jgi:hypothetical protein